MFVALWACSSTTEEDKNAQAEATSLDEVAPDSAEPDAQEESDTAEQPSDYIYDEEEQDSPSLPMTDVEDAITQALQAIFEIDPALFHNAYDRAIRPAYMAAAEGLDEDCPYYVDYYLEDYNQYYWSDNCTDERGTSFTGYGISYNTDEAESPDGYYVYNRYFYGDAAIGDSDGYLIEGSGYFSYSEYSTPGYSRWLYIDAYGKYRSDHPDQADTWLAQDLDIEIKMTATRYEGYPGNTMSLTASIGGLTGVVSSVRMEDVYLYNESLGSMCPGEPSGRVSVRDDEGNWYEVDFHGPKYWGAATFLPQCDGCGEVSWRGEPLGTVCPDFSPLLDWETRPW